MKETFWTKLKKPIFVLAPMADVTDAAFRRIIAKKGKPDITWTEFVSADGLALAPEEGRKKLMLDLIYSEGERPMLAQFFTSTPENMKRAAQLAASLGFDGIDINMGCPAKVINRQDAGACLIKTPEVAREIIRAAKAGAGGLPVSVKTRIGYNKVELETWLPALLAEEPAAITIHARTAKEMSKVPARWEFVKRAVEIRNEYALREAQGENERTLILGNGDVKDMEEARRRVEETGCDGVMFGRAIFGNPWLFNDGYTPSIEEKLRTLSEHIQAFDELLGHAKSFAIMKKHFKAYVSGFDGASELRHALMEAPNASAAKEIIGNYLTALSS
jgi:nifR3 family TIM-barrel protein